jgi:signal transduction histidine kinase
MRLRHIALAGLGLASVVVAATAVSVTQSGVTHLGIELDMVSGRVIDVSPTSIAWRDGIRPGQVVIDVRAATEPGGWQLRTVGPVGPIVSSEAFWQDLVRSLLPVALFSLVSAAFGLLFIRANREWAVPAVSLAFVSASIPLDIADHGFSRAALAIAAALPAGAAAWRLRRSPALAAGIITSTVLLLVGWDAYRMAGLLQEEDLEPARRMVAIGATGLLIADRAVSAARQASFGALTWRRATGWLGVPAMGIGALAIVYYATPAPMAMAVGLVALLGLPPLWTLVRPRLEGVLMADLRELAAADAAEEERARIARELHDVTLQGLSAAIRRLELVPQARAETDSLRAIADELRAVTIELRPPMLDDLGLGATLDYLAEQASGSGVAVVTHVVDETGIDPASRPPASVELALYRIAQEALTNALRHARASSVTITARILKRSIELEIADDGVGLRPDDQRRAVGQGRLGLASMRRRARGIGADLSLEGSPQGTKVTVTWQG